MDWLFPPGFPATKVSTLAKNRVGWPKELLKNLGSRLPVVEVGDIGVKANDAC